MDFIYKTILIKLLSKKLDNQKINDVLLEDSSIAFIAAAIITTPFLGTPLALAVGPGSYISVMLFLKVLKHLIKYLKENYADDMKKDDIKFLDNVLKQKTISEKEYGKIQKLLKKHLIKF